MKKALLFIYDTFADFEVTILLTCLKSKFEIITFTGNDKSLVHSCAGLQVTPNLTINNVNPEEYDVLIIPGGDPVSLLQNSALKEIVQHFYLEGKTIAAICGGPAILGAAGILEKVKYTASLDLDDPSYGHVLVRANLVNEHLVIDGNIITSTGSNYLNFAEVVLKHVGVYSEDMVDPIEYFRIPSMN
jgi:protein deglycase